MNATPTVMIVDDDTLVRISLAAVLECHGLAVREAAHADDAIALACGGGIHVAIVDLNLRGLDGQRLIPALHAISPSMAFIVHSGIAEYDLPPVLREIGVVDADVFLKPVSDMGLLVSRIRELAQRATTHAA